MTIARTSGLTTSLAMAFLVPTVALALHCGGNNPPPKTPASASGSADAGAPPILISSALPSAKLPPELVLTSRDVTPDGSPRCDARAASGKEPKATADALAKTCAGARRDQNALAQIASLDPNAAASSFDFTLKECAVVVASAEPAVKSYVVIVSDARGAPIVEMPGDAVTPSVASPVFCGSGKINVKVSVGMGAGKVAVDAELLHKN